MGSTATCDCAHAARCAVGGRAGLPAWPELSSAQMPLLCRAIPIIVHLPPCPPAGAPPSPVPASSQAPAPAS